MNNSPATGPQSSQAATPQDMGFSPWQRLKTKRISYLTLPMLVMATMVEFVILATGWKYQHVVCLPPGMAVTFFGIGPIGATILAVELLKLPLAIWTASREGWRKGLMLVIGLPLICLLTFQLVKDMAVYEMGVALTPASQMLAEAQAEEIKIDQLNGQLAAIDQKKAVRDRKLADLDAKETKAKADLDDSLKRNDESRQDAISLTDYQKKELSDVADRETVIIQQFNADTEQLNKSLAELRGRRETELARAAKWNAEEARIDNAYKQAMFAYDNKKAAYETAKTNYDNANFIARSVMTKPVDPGVPPQRESNTILKPSAIADLDAEINAKEAELHTVDNQRRNRVAQVEDDARQLRESFGSRSTTKREDADRNRAALLAAQAALATQWQAEQKQIEQEYEGAAQQADGLRTEMDASRKAADKLYDAREAAIRNTQVCRIATTVEIIRGLIMGQHPVSIKATAKERGDMLTDQISMVRIWVYPVLAFIVAFLPTLLVEVGFSTLFHPERQRPAYRLGFFGRHLHRLYTRAGRKKILRAERVAREASDRIAIRDKELAGLTDSLNRTVIERDALQNFQKSEIERQVQMRQNTWSEQMTQLRQELDDLRAASEVERTAMVQKHHQKLREVTADCKTQVDQARRQMAEAELAAEDKSARLTHDLKEALHARDTADSQLKQQVDALTLQLAQAREDAARETEKVTHQEQQHLDRQQIEFGKTLRQQEEAFEHRLKQREQELSSRATARETELINQAASDLRAREEVWEQQAGSRVRALETRLAHESQPKGEAFQQKILQREEDFEHRLKQREQQLQAEAEVRMRDLQSQGEEQLRRRELEFERQRDGQAREAETRRREELQQQELAFNARLQEHHQKLREVTADCKNQVDQARRQMAEAELAAEDKSARLTHDLKEALHARDTADSQLKQQVDALTLQLAQAREDAARETEKVTHQEQQRLDRQQIEFGKALRQQEEAFEHRLKQREQELSSRAAARETELINQAASDLRAREEVWEQQAGSRVRALETRLAHESQPKGEAFQQKILQREEDFEHRLKQREQELSLAFEARLTAEKNRLEQEAGLRAAEQERQLEARDRELEARWNREQQREDATQTGLKQREQQLQAEARLRDLQTQAEEQLRRRELEFERQREARSREAETRLRGELQQQELAFQAKLKEREQELSGRAAADLRAREAAWEQQAESRVRALEARLVQEAQQKEEARQQKILQHEQRLQSEFDAVQAVLQKQSDQDLQRRSAAEAEARKREQDLVAQAEAHQVAGKKLETELELARQSIESFKAQLARGEQERDAALESAAESARQLQELKRKLMAASSVLNGLENGKFPLLNGLGNGIHLVGGRG